MLRTQLITAQVTPCITRSDPHKPQAFSVEMDLAIVIDLARGPCQWEGLLCIIMGLVVGILCCLAAIKLYLGHLSQTSMTDEKQKPACSVMSEPEVEVKPCQCPHLRVTKRGTNFFAGRVTCKDCGGLVKSWRKHEPMPTTPTPAADPYPAAAPKNKKTKVVTKVTKMTKVSQTK